MLVHYTEYINKLNLIVRYKCYVTIYFLFSKCAIAIGTLKYVRVGYCVNIILHVFMHLKNACTQRDFKEHNHLIKYQYTFFNIQL